ncbi:O-antigen ligase family protein [Patescibacteria group bacterium]
MSRSALTLKSTIKYIFYLFVFLLPWQIRYIYEKGTLNSEFWEYGTKSLYAIELLLLIIIILYLAGSAYYIIKADFSKKNKSSKFFSNSKQILLAILFLIWALLSVAWSKNVSLAWYRWTILMQGIIVFLFLAKKIVNPRKVFLFFTAGAIIQSVFGIYQFFVQQILPNKWLGIAEQFPAKFGVSVVQVGDQRWLRAYGSLQHPNILAAYLGVALLLLILFMPHFFKENKIESEDLVKEKAIQEGKKFGISLIIFLLSIGIILTFSRAVWLGMAVAIIILVIYLVKNKKLKNIFSIPAIGFIVLFFLTLFMLKEPILARVTGNERLEIKSNQERMLSYKDGLGIIKDNWLLGTGIGNYTLELYKKNPNLSSWDYQPVHSMFMLIWAELGIIGLIIFLVFIFQIIKLALKEKFVLALIIFLLIISLFDHYFWSLYFGVILWWFAMGSILTAHSLLCCHSALDAESRIEDF